jgi:hypothetical protein
MTKDIIYGVTFVVLSLACIANRFYSDSLNYRISASEQTAQKSVRTHFIRVTGADFRDVSTGHVAELTAEGINFMYAEPKGRLKTYLEVFISPIDREVYIRLQDKLHKLKDLLPRDKRIGDAP